MHIGGLVVPTAFTGRSPRRAATWVTVRRAPAAGHVMLQAGEGEQAVAGE